jgi:hypothetical protein
MLKEIIYNHELWGKPYILTSFTGKAVGRMKQLTGIVKHAHTIHRFLSSPKAKKVLCHNMTVIVDEISMVTTELFYEFLKLLEPYQGIRFIFVGDNNQLPPISWGSLMDNCLASRKMPRYVLTENHRLLAGDDAIMRNSQAILDPPLFNPETDDPNKYKEFDFITGRNFSVVEGNLDTVKLFLSKLAESGVKEESITIISPYNQDLAAINRMAQEIFNAKQKAVIDSAGVEWRKNDRVMMTVNNYEIGIMNGDEGRVVDTGKDDIKVKFNDSSKVYTFSLHHIINDQHVEEDEDVPENQLSTKLIILGYGITIHKCVAGDTLISTPGGLKRIQDLTEYDGWSELNMDVYTRHGISPATYIYRGDIERSIKITTKRGYIIEGSYRHPLLVVENDKHVWKRMPTLQLTDILVLRPDINYGEDSPVFYEFDSIEKIEQGKCQMYDLHVPGEHSFISNGFVSHNCQGSENEIIIVYVPTHKAQNFVNRNLIYTAITRSRKAVFMIGDTQAMRTSVYKRQTKRVENLVARIDAHLDEKGEGHRFTVSIGEDIIYVNAYPERRRKFKNLCIPFGTRFQEHMYTIDDSMIEMDVIDAVYMPAGFHRGHAHHIRSKKPVIGPHYLHLMTIDYHGGDEVYLVKDLLNTLYDTNNLNSGYFLFSVIVGDEDEAFSEFVKLEDIHEALQDIEDDKDVKEALLAFGYSVQ